MSAHAGAIVVGGGPAGCAAAIGLARAGAPVTLLERERGPSAKVCGEFLSVEACEEARALGVDPEELGAAPIDRVRVTWRGTTVESRLPFRAQSLSRAAFDEALLVAAERAGARVERGARAVKFEEGRVSVRSGDALEERAASAIVLATGKADLAGVRREAPRARDALGFKMHLELEDRELAQLGTAVELTLLGGGYAGMQRIEGKRVAFAAVVDRAAFARFGSWRGLVAALRSTDARLARRLGNARELWAKPLAVSGVPYGFVYRDDAVADTWCYRVGDQLAVIPSFTGDGIAIALVSGSSAAAAIVRGEGAARFHAAMRRRLAKPMFVSGALSRAIASPAGRAAVVWPASVIPAIFSQVAAHTRIAR